MKRLRQPELLDELYPLLSREDSLKAKKLFYRELTAAVSGLPSSLPAIVNPLARAKPSPGYGVAVSIGGTNGYVSAFRINKKGAISFFSRRSFVVPRHTTKNELFHLITRHVLVATRKQRKPFPIGINFAYPLKPLLHHGFIDGVLTDMTKDRSFEGLVGKQVGLEYHRFLIEHYAVDTTVAVANDTICLLLGGNSADIAGVIGTGVNFAYWETCSRIASEKRAQMPGFSGKEVAINIESANFDKIPGTMLRDHIDRHSDKPGVALAEKEAAGAYLYQLFNAGKEKIVGSGFPDLVSTDQLNDMITGAFTYPRRLSSVHQKAAQRFAERLFRRSAQIVAIELCGILTTLNKTEGVVPIVMEGSLFWKAKRYSSLVNEYMNALLPNVIPTFARLFGSSRRGAAILARSDANPPGRINL